MRGRIDPGAWNDASLRWLVDPVSPPEGDLPGGVRVGLGDVERFRVTVEAFAQLDDRFGGGHARPALIQYLSSDGDRLLRGRYTAAVGSALFSSVAEATLLAAWMSYDTVPRSALAQRYFIQALALAQAAGDRLLGASILDAMSHQATYTGRFGEAANLARAARTGTTGIATATLTAHFHTMEARALARLGDARDATGRWRRRWRSSSGAGPKMIRAGSGTSMRPSWRRSSGTACGTSGGPRMRPITRAAAWRRRAVRGSPAVISSPRWCWPMRTWRPGMWSRRARRRCGR